MSRVRGCSARCRISAAMASSISESARGARWTRWRSRSPMRSSATRPGRFGGLEGLALRRGDVLPLLEDVAELSQGRFGALKISNGRSVRWSAPPQTVPDREPILIHAIEGQHFAGFDAASQRAFFDA